jgi:hypothetical protein
MQVFLFLCAAAVDAASVSVLCSKRSCRVVPSESPWTARATFNDTVNASGWGTIVVESNAEMPEGECSSHARHGLPAETRASWMRVASAGVG